MPSLGNDDVTIQIKTTADTSGATKSEEAISNVGSKAKKSGEDASEGGGHFGKLWEQFAVGELAAHAVEKSFDFVKESIGGMIEAASENQAAFAQVQQGITSTGAAAGITAEHAQEMADSISSTEPVSKAAIATGQAMLLTFTGIKGEAFDQTTQAAVDLATKFNGGLVPSAQQVQQQALLLGKALNDPATGLSKLSREGVTFSKQQQEQVKAMVAAGNTAGAQAVMLQELQKEFGGSAEAAGHTFPGALAMAKNALDELKASAGEEFEKAMTEPLRNMVPVIQSLGPVVAQLGEVMGQVGGAIVAIMPDVVSIITSVIQAISAILPALTPVIVIFAQFIAQLAQMLVPIIKMLTPLFAPMASLLQMIADTVVAVLKALMPLITGGLNILVQIFKALEPALETIIDALGNGLVKIFDALKPAIPPITQALTLVANAFADIMTALAPVIPLLADLVVQIIQMLIPFLPLFVQILKALLPAIIELVPPLVQLAELLIPLLTDTIKILVPIITWLAGILTGVLVGAINVAVGAFGWIMNQISNVIGWFKGLGSNIIGAVSGFGSLLFNAGKDLINGLVNGLNGAKDAVVHTITDVAKNSLDAIKNFFGIHSPSTVMHEMGGHIGQGLINGINSMQGGVADAMTNLAGGGLNAAVNVYGSVAGGGNMALSGAGGGGSYSSVSNNNSSSTSMTVQNMNVTLGDSTAVQEWFRQLNQDTVNVGKGLSMGTGGAF